MAKAVHTIPITQIILDEEIYPRSGVYPKRVSMFAENIRDGFKIDPIEVQIHPEYGDKYRILDGAHRWHAFKEIGATEITVLIVTPDDLDGIDPLLYATKKAIGPLQLTEEEARTTARRAYENNPRLTSFEIGQAIGRSRQAVDSYIADLRDSTELEMDLEILRMHLLANPKGSGRAKYLFFWKKAKNMAVFLVLNICFFGRKWRFKSFMLIIPQECIFGY